TFIFTCCAFRKRKISTNVTSSEISVTKWKKFCIEKSFYLVLDTKSFRFLLELTNFCTNAQQVYIFIPYIYLYKKYHSIMSRHQQRVQEVITFFENKDVFLGFRKLLDCAMDTQNMD